MSEPAKDPKAPKDDDVPTAAPIDDPLDRTMPAQDDPLDRTVPVGDALPQAAPPPVAAPSPPVAPKPPSAPKPPGPPKPPGMPKPPGAPKPPSPPVPVADAPAADAAPAAPSVPAPPSAPKPPGPPKPPGMPKPPGAPKPPSPPVPVADAPAADAAPAAPSVPAPPSAPKPPGPPKPPGMPKPPGAPKPPSPPAPVAETPVADAAPAAPKPPAPPKAPGVPKPPGAPPAPKPPGAPAAPSAGPAAPKAPGAPAAPKVPGAAAAAPAVAKAAAPAEPPADPNSPEGQLATVPLFREVSPALRKTIVEECQFRVISPKTVICREGDYTADFYVILNGMVGVYKAAGEKTTYLASLTTNAWFGEMSCMSNAPRAASVIAETDAVVVSVPRHTFMKIYGDKKSAGFKKLIDEAYRERALANHLSVVSLFRGVKESVLKRIAGVAELVVAEKGEAIVREGDPGEAFFLVRTGHARVTRGEEILAWLCENSFFGEVALIEDRPRGSTVTAVDRMDLVRIAKVPFLALLDQHPEVKDTVLQRVRRILETEFVSSEEAEAQRRAREIGTEHEVVKAGAALVIDMSKCTRCNMCVEGCIEAHDDRIPRIGKRGIQYGDLLLTSSCYNCKVPDCMLACKFGAIRRDRSGQVLIDPESCTGCALCEPACPYGTIHMQSLVGDGSLEVKASPISSFLGKIPFVSGFMKPKAVAPAPAAKPADDGGKKRLRMAVKCDLCAGRADMACIYNCPCGAIERIDPSVLLG